MDRKRNKGFVSNFISATKTYEILKTAFGYKYLRLSNVFIWLSKFLIGREPIDNDPPVSNFNN